MRLSEFAVTNYMAVKDQVKLSPLATANALIGPNNQGKSAILDALYLARNMVDLDWRETDPLSYMTERLPDKDFKNQFQSRLLLPLGQSDFPRLSVTIRWGRGIRGGDPSRTYPVDVKLELSGDRRVQIVQMNDGRGEPHPFSGV